jgi:hypothetical protein
MTTTALDLAARVTMTDYFIQWGHAYIVHFGAWVSFALAANLYKNGLPEPRKLPSIILAAVVLAAVASIFSSHSHTHFLQHFSLTE